MPTFLEDLNNKNLHEKKNESMIININDLVHEHVFQEMEVIKSFPISSQFNTGFGIILCSQNMFPMNQNLSIFSTQTVKINYLIFINTCAVKILWI